MPKNILKRSVTCMFTMAREVIILLLFSIFYGTEQCENFRYTKDVSAPNAIQIITNVSTESVDYLRGSCVSECMSKIDCNAIDVCGTYCRLIRGWDSLYMEQIAATTCQRFQIVRILHLLNKGERYFSPRTCVVYNILGYVKGGFRKIILGYKYSWCKCTYNTFVGFI